MYTEIFMSVYTEIIDGKEESPTPTMLLLACCSVLCLKFRGLQACSLVAELGRKKRDEGMQYTAMVIHPHCHYYYYFIKEALCHLPMPEKRQQLVTRQ